ncbi:MAG TPA: AMP-binding protein [Caulobacteraceae bacterium]|jgi:malonyl-CoA/methylmalonyl-CoA synthetase|nr:AMP-binding protein [Caulobacteraceae bacterium]
MNGNLYARLAAQFPAERNKAFARMPDGREVSYGALEAGAGRLATLLQAKGVAPGDRVAVQTAKSLEAVMLYLAALKLGAVLLPLNTAYTAAEVDYFVTDAEPSLFVTDAVALAAEAANLAPLETVHEAAPDDLAAILYTSGTTGRSKGALLTHGALAANGQALTDAWGFTAGDVLLHALPIYHVHGLFIALHCVFLSGSTVLWLPKFDEAEVLAALRQSTVMMGVPTFYTRLLADPNFTREATETIRLFVCGSAPLLPSTFADFEQRIGQPILERYGMSEAAIITTNPLVGERIAGSVGYPLPGVDLRVADDGLVQIKGPSVTRGYWRKPEKTAEAFTADGYFITGDIGRQDDDGRLWLSGRSSDLIISGGLNVYPKEIELVLDEMAGVVESAVIGCPHPDFGEAVVAVVAGAGDEAAMIAEMRTQLAVFKCPKRVFFVADLPRNTMGKVLKADLRRTYADVFKV